MVMIILFLLAVFSVFLLVEIIQLFYYFFYYLAVYVYKPPVIKLTKQPVSVIICAKNEAVNLDNFLPSVLEQDYPDYEVIVVNDCSEDNSYDVLGKYLMKYPHLRVSTIIKDPKFTHNKKFAQFIGIKAAKNDILLFTDADCQPDSDKWIEGMISNFDDNITFVLGYGGYLKEKRISEQIYPVRQYDDRNAISGNGYTGNTIYGRWTQSGIPPFSILRK